MTISNSKFQIVKNNLFPNPTHHLQIPNSLEKIPLYQTSITWRVILLSWIIEYDYETEPTYEINLGID
jgi:hypothetical protein